MDTTNNPRGGARRERSPFSLERDFKAVLKLPKG